MNDEGMEIANYKKGNSRGTADGIVNVAQKAPRSACKHCRSFNHRSRDCKQHRYTGVSYPNKNCKSWVLYGRCSYGERCNFKHLPEQKAKGDFDPNDTSGPTTANANQVRQIRDKEDKDQRINELTKQVQFLHNSYHALSTVTPVKQTNNVSISREQNTNSESKYDNETKLTTCTDESGFVQMYETMSTAFTNHVTAEKSTRKDTARHVRRRQKKKEQGGGKQRRRRQRRQQRLERAALETIVEEEFEEESAGEQPELITSSDSEQEEAMEEEDMPELAPDSSDSESENEIAEHTERTPVKRQTKQTNTVITHTQVKKKRRFNLHWIMWLCMFLTQGQANGAMTTHTPTTKKKMVILDTGCTDSTTDQRWWLTNVLSTFVKMSTANKSSNYAKEKGTLKIDGIHIPLLYVPEFDKTLISWTDLAERGITGKMGKDTIELYKADGSKWLDVNRKEDRLWHFEELEQPRTKTN